MHAIEVMSDRYGDLSKKVCAMQEEYESLYHQEGASRGMSVLQNDIVQMELEMRSIRRNVLEGYHAMLPFWRRWSVPRYWEVVCPIKLKYKNCESLPWYDHVSRRWYESEESALIGAYRFLKTRGAHNKLEAKPLAMMVNKLIKCGDGAPEYFLGKDHDYRQPAALPAPSAS